MRKTLLGGILAAAVAATAAGGLAAAEPALIGFIYPSPVADVGWAKQLDLGRYSYSVAFGDNFKIFACHNIP